MTMRTCVECGTVTEGARCPAHRLRTPKRKTNTEHAAFKNGIRWKKFSRRLRRQSPFCEDCGTTEHLSVDHIVRVAERPEWTYEPDNCRILCLTCNGRIANLPASAEVEAEVARRIDERRRGGIPLPRIFPDPRPKSSLPSHIMRQES